MESCINALFDKSIFNSLNMVGIFMYCYLTEELINHVLVTLKHELIKHDWHIYVLLSNRGIDQTRISDVKHELIKNCWHIYVLLSNRGVDQSRTSDVKTCAE